MKILALEFSSTHRSIAVADVLEDEPRILHQRHEPFSRSSSVAPIHDLLQNSAQSGGAISPLEIDIVAIGLGPGSYTGIRSSISIAQGFELAAKTKIIGVSSMEVLATQLAWEGESGEFHLVADAQKGDVYYQQFRLAERKAHSVSTLKIVPIACLFDLPRQSIVGPQADHFFPGSRSLAPRATTLATMSLTEKETIAGEKLEPIYLREIAFVKAKPPRLIV